MADGRSLADLDPPAVEPVTEALRLLGFALSFIALGIGIGLSIYHYRLAWFMGHRDPDDLKDQAAKAIVMLERRRQGLGGRPILGSQRGRHLARPETRPQEAQEGPQEPGNPSGDSAPDLEALRAVEPLESRRLDT
jgi:hypothetical protein